MLAGLPIGRVIRARRDDLDRYLETVRIEPVSFGHSCSPTMNELPERSRRARIDAGLALLNQARAEVAVVERRVTAALIDARMPSLRMSGTVGVRGSWFGRGRGRGPATGVRGRW
jgi:hypothetical protein